MTQLSMFDPLDRMQQEVHASHLVPRLPPITAEESKQEAIARVARHTPDEWKAAFMRAIVYVARRRVRFNADPVWTQFQRDYCAWEDAHPRAAGHVVLQAVKDGTIVIVKNMFWNSERRSCHGRPIQVYQSCIFEQEDPDAE